MEKQQLREELKSLMAEYHEKHPPKDKPPKPKVRESLITIYHPHQTEEVKI
jgi:hypothetical protein